MNQFVLSVWERTPYTASAAISAFIKGSSGPGRWVLGGAVFLFCILALLAIMAVVVELAFVDNDECLANAIAESHYTGTVNENSCP